ncbi:hypothetical protein QUA07_24410 [Microcoleus sp. T3_A4]|uniref:hypothetical protein n=1 Tax=Microcoleus sp. T3_A4 TaxID=2818968 RepID=UPI002FD55894
MTSPALSDKSIAGAEFCSTSSNRFCRSESWASTCWRSARSVSSCDRNSASCCSAAVSCRLVVSNSWLAIASCS